MLKLELGNGRKPLRLLCLGAHSDDLEIGCGATLLEWIARHRGIRITWVVMSAGGKREAEARVSARALLKGAANPDIVLRDFQDGRLPAQFSEAKAFFEELKRRGEYDAILTHRLEDRHQDHRLVAELTWQTWRDHLVLEYEVPKYEGDLGLPNLYVPVSERSAKKKVALLMKHFGSQRSKAWFDERTFMGLMRVRGVECRAPSGLAEGHYVRKAVI